MDLPTTRVKLVFCMFYNECSLFCLLLLEYLRRQPIEKNSELVERIIRDNESTRLSSYIEAGCRNTHDSVHTMSKCKCFVNLESYLYERTVNVKELYEVVLFAVSLLDSVKFSLLFLG